jgi:hypothetical protein
MSQTRIGAETNAFLTNFVQKLELQELLFASGTCGFPAGTQDATDYTEISATLCAQILLR